MEHWRDYLAAQGAVFEPEGTIPLSFGDEALAYRGAHEAAVLVDLSDEGRIELTGTDRLKIVHRMSTNAVEGLTPGDGRATVLTTPIGRIIDRIILHALDGERTLVRTNSRRGALIADYLRRNIFFRDRMQVREVTQELVLLGVYGPQVGKILSRLGVLDASPDLHRVRQVEWDGLPLLVLGLDPLGVPGVGLIVPLDGAIAPWQAVLAAGAEGGLVPAGRTALDVLRIEAGVPGPSGELNEEFIPLEAGLWADISFSKGCYTGQEIIARMESRGRLARTLVGVGLSGPAVVGTSWLSGGRVQGMLTSLAQRPDGAWIGLGFVRPELAMVGQTLDLEGGAVATIVRVTGGG